MTVVPGMTVLSRLEVVCEGITISNRTLGNAVDTIGCVCMELPDSMPVDCCPIVWKVIRDMHSLEESLVSLGFTHLNNHRLEDANWKMVHQAGLAPGMRGCAFYRIRNVRYRHPSKPQLRVQDNCCSKLCPQS